MPICASCAAPASSRCARCATVSYCSTECQRAAWPSHRAACAPPRCFHNAPSIAAAPAAALLVSQLLPALAADATAAGHLSLLDAAARADEATARAPATLRLLRAAALDAALGGDNDAARTALRAAAFFAAFASDAAFLSALCGAEGGAVGDGVGDGGVAAATSFAAALSELPSKDGLLAALDDSSTCGCAARVRAAVRV